MTVSSGNGSLGERFVGLELQLGQWGEVTLEAAMWVSSETAIYRTNHPEVVVKIFDLDCGLPDEVSYGPYVEFQLEVANFEEIQSLSPLQSLVPRFYGADIHYERRFAYVGMEFLAGQDLQEWCDAGVKHGESAAWVKQFRRTAYETFAILERFHENRIVVIDFKPENVLRLPDGHVRFVDMGAFFTPRYLAKTKEYLYSATPDYAELLIDSANVESGIPLTQASDIFASGVALFEMVTGDSRLSLAPETAEDILQDASVYLFRDSQIKDTWKAYPHLEGVLPLVENQLREGRVLFSELWHILKGYMASGVEQWDHYSDEEKDELFLKTGEDFIRGHLSESLAWLARPIARATTLRSLRLESVAELMALVRDPASQEVLSLLEGQNVFLQFLKESGQSSRPLERLNAWDVRFHEESGRWAISGPACCQFVEEEAAFTSVGAGETDYEGNTYYHLANEDEPGHEPQSLIELKEARSSWIL